MLCPGSLPYSSAPAKSAIRRIAGPMALLLASVLWSSVAAKAQQDQGITSPKGITPAEVIAGSAKLVSPLDANQKLRLVIALRPPKLAEERKFIEDLQTKGSPSFGKFLTPEQWNQRFAPSVADEQAVVDWAKSQGFTVTDRFPNRLLVDVEAPAAVIEKAFNLKLNKYMVAGSERFSSDRDPELSGNLVSIVQNVQGLNNIRMMHPMRKGAVVPNFPIYAPGPAVGNAVASGANSSGPKPKSLTAKSQDGLSSNITGGAYDPTDIYSSQAYDVQALYNQGHCCNPFGNAGGSPKETTIAIATAGAQDWNDIAGFHSTYPYLAYHMFQIPIDGTTVPCNPSTATCDGEGTMDAEWSTAMSNSFGSLVNTSQINLYDGVDSGFGTFDHIYNRILSDNSTRIMSTSWGCQEIACYDPTDMNTTDAIFMNMVGQGWTLVVASGDSGATAGCGDADAVQFPASDPHVVGAGGTTLHLNSSGNFVSETAWSGNPDGCAPPTNGGGSGGGVSAYWGVPSFQSGFGYSGRAVPDLALNADWYNTPQNLYFGGFLQGNGGTSIVAPELAGIFAQYNAYLLTLGNNCANEGGPCAPMGGLVDSMIYYFGNHPGYAPHYPFYDVTTGCNNNNVTAYYGLPYFCAAAGYDPVTGWGSINALQLAWAINTYRAGDFGRPNVSFSGPTTSHWYNTDQNVSWAVSDTSGLSGYSPNGVAGFSQAWDSDPGDVFSEATPGSGNSFYSGPQFPNATTGYLAVSWAGEGCHYTNVRAWDNSGFTSGDAQYGPVCYDITAPVTTASLSGTTFSGKYVGNVRVTLSATDSHSGVAGTFYQIDGGVVLTYSAPFNMGIPGNRTVTYYSKDKAGNLEAHKSAHFTILAPSATALYTSDNPATFRQIITFTTVVSSSSGTPTGNVQLKDGGTVLQTLALSSGKAHFYISTLSAGTHTITAVYQGDSNHGPSTSSALAQVVKSTLANTTAALYSSANPAQQGQNITFTAKLTAASGTPSGNVQLKNGSTVVQTLALSSGVAHFNVSSLSVGSHSMTVVYGGDVSHNGTTSPVLQEVVKATSHTALYTSGNPVNHGANITFTSVVSSSSGTPTGSVQLKDGSTVLQTLSLSSGVIHFNTSSLSKGTHSITAAYQGDSTHLASGSAVISEVVK